MNPKSFHIVFSQIKWQLEIEREFHGSSYNVCSTIWSKIIWEESLEQQYRVILLNFSHFYRNWNNRGRISMKSALAITHESFISQLVARNDFWVILFNISPSVIRTQNSRHREKHIKRFYVSSWLLLFQSEW